MKPFTQIEVARQHFCAVLLAFQIQIFVCKRSLITGEPQQYFLFCYIYHLADLSNSSGRVRRFSFKLFQKNFVKDHSDELKAIEPTFYVLKVIKLPFCYSCHVRS